MAAVQTLMWPYYEQNVKAPLPFVFEQVGLPMAKTVITVGALAGLSTSLLGAMFPLPRILYAMATDGLLFRPLGAISARFKTPLVATAVAGLFSALMATFFDVDQLAEMMSIGKWRGEKIRSFFLFAHFMLFLSRNAARLQPGRHLNSHSKVNQKLCFFLF